MGESTRGDGPETTPVVSCDLQGGTLSVHEDRVEIDRSSASMFEDKSIDTGEIRGVEYTGGILTGHIQIRQAGFESDESGRFSHPVDENTLYVPRSRRSCARRARDAILERAGGG
jgi:hypothetical protein